jgi:hypothetical protein
MSLRSNSREAEPYAIPSHHTGRVMDTIVIIVVMVLGYVAALAWRDAAQSAFETYYPDDSNSVKARLIYAAIATLAAVIIITWLARLRR